MGAQSFGDFIDRVGAVATILEADQGILRQHQDDKSLLEEKQLQVEQELASLEKMMQDLETMNLQLNTQREQKDQLMATLEQQEEEIQGEKLELEEQAQILAAQQAAVQQSIKMEEERQAEQARQAAAAAAAAAAANSGGTGTGSTSTPAPAPAPVVSNGAWTRPAAGVLTSGLGQRWGTFHAGIDIANRVSVPILAAADGVVIKSYYSPSYGNAIFLTHYINGQTYTTVYAHMSSRTVSSGVVKKGQVIGYMGNTGYSQGQHLHFELHVGQWNASKSNAVNPLNYIPM